MKFRKTFPLLLALLLLLLPGCQTADPGPKATEPTVPPDPNEIITVYCITEARATSKNSDDVVVTTLSYDVNGNLISRIRAGNGTQVTLEKGVYDSRHNRLRYDYLGNTTYYTYDNQDRLLTVNETFYGMKQIHYTYDSLGNLLTETRYSGDRLGKQITYTYDTNNNLLTQTTAYPNDPLTADHITCWEYDEQGHPLVVKSYEGDTLVYLQSNTYDAAGNHLTQSREQNGYPISRFVRTYDRNGYLISEENYNQGVLLGVPGEETKPLSGSLYTYRYDSMGNLVEHKTLSLDGKTVISTTKWTYDESGNLLSYEHGPSRNEYSYDSHGNVLSYDWFYNGEWSHRVTFQYTSFDMPRWAAEKIAAQHEDWPHSYSGWR